MKQLIERSIESAMDDGDNLVRSPVVSLKVRQNGRKVKQMDEVRVTDLPFVGNQVVRIINECDPVGFLSDIVNGKAIQCHVVDANGEIQSFYETPTLKSRIEVAKFLGERYMPKVAVIKHAHLHKNVDPDHQQGKEDGRRNWDQIQTHAANQSPSGDE